MSRPGRATAVLFLAGLLLFIWRATHESPPRPVMPSVAVLSFTALGLAPEDRNFSAVLTRAILDTLSAPGDLRVTPWEQVARLGTETRPLREVAEELRVDAVLEGSARRAGGRVRVVVQLIEAKTDSALWAESFDRALEDLPQLQAEIVGHVRSALVIRQEGP